MTEEARTGPVNGVGRAAKTRFLLDRFGDYVRNEGDTSGWTVRCPVHHPDDEVWALVSDDGVLQPCALNCTPGAMLEALEVRRRAEPGDDDDDPTPVVAAKKQRAPLFLPVDDFFATCFERVEYVLEPYLPKDGFLLIGGAPKSGKTWFLGWLAGEISATDRVVMFVEEEGSKETLRARLEPFKRAGARIHVSHRNGWRLDDERSVNRLIEEARAVCAHVIILDPLNQLHAQRKIGDVPAEVIQAIQRIIRETGAAVVIAHHTRKGESWNKDSEAEAQSADLAGSFAWAGSADNILHIKSVPTADRKPGQVRFFVENPDTRNGEPLPRRLAVVKPGPYREDSITFDEPETPAMKALQRILPVIPDNPAEALSVDAIRKAAGIGKTVGQSGVDLGLRTGALVRRVKGGCIYRVKNVGPDATVRGGPAPIGPSDRTLKGESDGESDGEDQGTNQC